MSLKSSLYARHWKRNYVENLPEELEIVVLNGGEIYKGVRHDRIEYVEELLDSWYGAWSLHRYMVEHFCDGWDHSYQIELEPDQVVDLLSNLKRAARNKGKNGPMHFPSYHSRYDKEYMREVKMLIEDLQKIVDEPWHENRHYIYKASW